MAADDEAAQRARAAKLRAAIEQLREGERPPREFVEQQMRDRARDQDEDAGDEEQKGDA